MNGAPSSSALPVKAYQLLIWLGSHLQSLFLLTVRLVWGWQFFETGKGKLANPDKVASFFNDLHIPAPKFNAYFAGGIECFGGLLLCLGLAGRLVSVPLTIVMLVAYWTAERPDIHSFDDFVKATPFPFLLTVLLVLIFGPGRFSIDYLLQRFVFKRGEDPLAGFRADPVEPRGAFEPIPPRSDNSTAPRKD
jgi:putative oxidoreductase